ncbi:succinate-semialdehyde dehydrogenase [Cephaloticoccus primus]|uniref:Succinate-semialdehyde dehydrogenase n=1 Tax=Cephaloticoccus primus TaxID=1548207 RepID=A0A139ST60_9BACT|nr:NAD-dependent succinate-semialdehyde dehydrogenase [Cephaloticoccus primus]KXU37671.1 succinate-semialdehyde dehydrogenase [Cephaloticoccus primus]
MSLISINPATGQRIHIYGVHSSVQIEAALKQARAAFLGWRELAAEARAAAPRKLAHSLRKQGDDLAALITAEMGKPITQARAEIEKCARVCDYYARHGAGYLADEHPSGAPRQARVVYEPLGPILAIMPWNFPFWQVFRTAAPALMAGNTVLLKHAPNTSGCALAVEQVFEDAGLPRGVLQTLLISSETLTGLIGDPRVAAVSLTGSTEVGRAVAAAAGAALKPCVLELGGSDPYLVLEDADLDHAAQVCARARLINGGQSCISAKRFIVHEKVRADFQRRLVKYVRAHRVGDPLDPQTQVGPLARGDLRERLHAQVTRSVAMGARCLLGGESLSGPGFFYAPSVLTDVVKGMPAFDEELFGPVAVVIAARSAEEAVALANATPYGLGAAIFTGERARARDIVPLLEEGMVFINEAVHSDPALPFGGVKQSGFGRELGRPGIHAFVNTKCVWEAR